MSKEHTADKEIREFPAIKVFCFVIFPVSSSVTTA